MLVSGRGAAIAGAVFFAGGIWLASEWWEKSWGSPIGMPRTSPNGCYRVESYQPFWVLPAMFHRRVFPDVASEPEWFPWWGSPGFYRLYDRRNGQLIAETDIFDLEGASGPVYWGDRSMPRVSAGLIYIGPNVPDCIGGGRGTKGPIRGPELAGAR